MIRTTVIGVATFTHGLHSLHMGSDVRSLRSFTVALERRDSTASMLRIMDRYYTKDGLESYVDDSGRFDESILHRAAYFGKVDIGSPRQTLTVMFDTGSGNLIVPGSECLSSACKVHKNFRINASSTLKGLPCDPEKRLGREKIRIKFGTGSITGQCAEDLICVGSICSRGSFVVATEESSRPFEALVYDGVLGLSRESMANGKMYSMMSRLIHQGRLVKPIFSVYMSDTDFGASEITFGDVKEEFMDSEFFWVDSKRDSGYWEVTLDDIAIDNKLQGLLKHCRAVVDTGTSQFAGPSVVVDRISQIVGAKGGLASDCKHVADLPKLGFSIGGHILNLEPRDYIYENLHCKLSFMKYDVPPPKGPIFIFGIPFLQKYYTVFDAESAKIGFAAAKQPGKISEKPVPHDTKLFAKPPSWAQPGQRLWKEEEAGKIHLKLDMQ